MNTLKYHNLKRTNYIWFKYGISVFLIGSYIYVNSFIASNKFKTLGAAKVFIKELRNL